MGLFSKRCVAMGSEAPAAPLTSRSYDPPHIPIARSSALVKKVEQVLLHFLFLHEVRDNECCGTALPVSAHDIGLPGTAFSLDRDDSAKDVEAKGLHCGLMFDLDVRARPHSRHPTP